MKKLAVAALLLGGLGTMTVPILIGLVAVLLGASAIAAQSPCVSTIGSVLDTGEPVRLPVVGRFVPTSEYGMRSNPGDINTGQYRMHWGLDLAETTPTAVVAVKDGVVKATPDSAGGGHEIHIDHGAGLETTYQHLSSRTVQVGDRVWAGKQVGVEGSTGNSSGPHVHLEVQTNGARVNPRTWLRQQGIAVPAEGVAGTAPPAVAFDPASLPALHLTPSPVPLSPTSDAGDTKPVVTNFPTLVGAYTGAQVLNAGYIIRAGQSMTLDAKTITLAVMTAMGESSLLNVGHGDAAGPDSRGLFQQRDPWGSLAERMNPTTSATMFFKALIAVPSYLALEPTVAAHKAQHNADPYHYAPYWGPAVQMVATLTADPSLLDRLPVAGPVTGCENGGIGDPLPAGDLTGDAIVAAARNYLGTPYSWGGGNTSGPSLGIYQAPSLDGSHTVGFDCAGLVLFAVHTSTGIALAHSAETQGQDPRGQTVPRDWTLMQPGDVIAFSEDGSGAPGSFGHVGIYLGAGKMIHAPRPGGTAEIVQLKDVNYYESMAWSIKRYANRPL